MNPEFAFDLSNRTRSADGFLHVAMTNISKATVNPYKGSEIPDWRSLGLEADRIYNLYRDPAELERAAPTFNNLPLLSRHVPISAEMPSRNLWRGSTGTDAVFEDPYLKNSLVIWDAEAIAGVETGVQRELSCCYRFRADMVAGSKGALSWDGIMRDIVGNHVALVEAGRAGPDVMVADSKLEIGLMATKQAILEAALKGKLVADAALDVKAVLLALDAAEKDCAGDEGESEEEKEAREAREKAAADKKKARDKKAKDAEAEAETEEEKREREAADKRAKDKKAKDEENAEAAMDAALKTVRESTIKQMNDRDAAKEAVRPFVGAVMGMDSAEDVYRFALKNLGVDVEGVHPSAFATILKMQPKPGSVQRPAMAMDGGANDDFDAIYPGAAHINHA